MTLTVVARDGNSGALGVALSTNPLAVGSRCPFVKANVGAISTQAYADPGLGPLAINLLAMGFSPAKVLKELQETDEHFAWRQIGIVDAKGRSAVFTGDKCKGHCGAVAGAGYVVMGNYLLTQEVVPAMDKSWKSTEGQLLEDRLLAAITAGRDEGGDLGGHRSAAILVHDDASYPRTDLRIDFVPKRDDEPDAVDMLQDLMNRWRPLIPYYKKRPQTPTLPGWFDWLEQNNHPFKD